MDLKEFAENLKMYIEDGLPERLADAQVIIFPVKKLNTSYLGMSLKGEGITAMPTLNLNELFHAYEERPGRLPRLAEYAVDTLCNNTLDLDVSKLLDYDYIKDHLFVRVSNLDKNTEILRSVPYREEAGLAITYHILVGEGENNVSSTILKNELLQNWGITKERLHEDAVKSSQVLFPVRVAPMKEIMAENMIAEGVDPEFVEMMVNSMEQESKTQLYVVTTKGSLTEASALFYPSVMDELAEKVGSDLIIFPSSTHEFLVIPDDGEHDIEELKALVSMINETEVEPEERLADDVFHYDTKEKVFERAEDFATRKQMKELEGTQKESVMDKMKEKKEQAKGYIPQKKESGKDLGPVL